MNPHIATVVTTLQSCMRGEMLPASDTAEHAALVSALHGVKDDDSLRDVGIECLRALIAHMAAALEVRRQLLMLRVGDVGDGQAPVQH